MYIHTQANLIKNEKRKYITDVYVLVAEVGII